MIPTIPQKDTTNFKESLYPTRWEHLFGPFAWLNWQDDKIVREGPLYEKYGPYVYAQRVGPIGEMVQTFSETGYFPEKAYLLSGPQGIGKTAFIKLMALTNLVSNHAPVRLNEEVIVLNPDTDEPYLINPIEDGYTFEAIQNAINNPGQKDNTIECHNAAMMYKDDVARVSESISSYLTLLGGRRVIIINEFDNIGQRQVTPLKSALDPGGSVPDGLILLADTNYPDKVKKTLDRPGMARFKHLDFGEWPTHHLFQRAKFRLDQFGVEFNEPSFDNLFYKYGEQHGIPQDEVPAYHLAVLANGAIRDLHTYVGSVVRFERPVTLQDIQEITEEHVTDVEQEESFDTTQLLDIYFNRVVQGQTTTASFTKQAASRQQSVTNFVTRLIQALYTREEDYSQFTTPHVHEALQSLLSIVEAKRQGPPIKELRWAAAARPLHHIAKQLQSQQHN